MDNEIQRTTKELDTKFTASALIFPITIDSNEGRFFSSIRLHNQQNYMNLSQWILVFHNSLSGMISMIPVQGKVHSNR